MEDTEYSLSFGLASVTSSGLKFEDKLYTNAKLIKYGWFQLAEEEKGWQIPIIYDSKDSSRIMLLDIDSIRSAFLIEDASQRIDPKMRELYFSAIASLSVQLRHKKKNDRQS